MQQKRYLKKSCYPLFRLLSYLSGQRKDYIADVIFSTLNKLFDIFPEVLIGVEQGTHADLVNNSIRYRHLWSIQTRAYAHN